MRCRCSSPFALPLLLSFALPLWHTQPGLPNAIRADASLGFGSTWPFVCSSARRLHVCLFVCCAAHSGWPFCGPSALGPKEMVRLNCVTVFAPTDTAIEAAANASALHGGEVCCIIMQRATDTCRAACSLRRRRTRPDSRQCKRDGQ